MLLSIGQECLDRDPEAVYFMPDGTESRAHMEALAVIGERDEVFVRWVMHPDEEVRRPAIEGLGLFLTDGARALEVLRSLLPGNGMVQRLLVVRAVATVALRDAAVHSAAADWPEDLAGDTAQVPEVRLAALVHRVRCTPGELGDAVVPAAVGLIREIAPKETGGEDDAPCRAETEPDVAAGTALSSGVPPQVAAAFEDLECYGRVHAPTSSLLESFHTVLDNRVLERTALLTEQLCSADPGVRYDAISMARKLIGQWRGDYTGLVVLIAGCLLPEDPYTSAAAAEVLGVLVPVSELAREALAAYVEAARAKHGPGVWAARERLIRRAHQEAVRALASLGDLRALDCVLEALDGGTDAWRAVQVAGHLGETAGDLTPRLSKLLAEVDFSDASQSMSANALVSALRELGDPAAAAALASSVTVAVREEQWHTAASALKALASFGPEAAFALDVVRPLADAQDVTVRAAATAALWELEGDAAGVVPRLVELLDTHAADEAAAVLGRIGPAAAPALPRLRKMLTAGYEWTRVYAAAALWDIAGAAEASVVVETLLTAWAENDSTSNHVLACLNRMGPAARPALPRVRKELTLLRRSGRFRSIPHDEDLLTACRSVTARI
ncbi:HEAT repeat domain-containing protein [Streptomyces drozdowiczii]|uniref:HEAT repeat domain-containing protein n=1 Tax=Streptomyces drozdowiczii TaxID=202862 RepID=A0ABY6PKJ1_9ACTN|nr:HEAT repeat domain-containing protein [Streptomyces drozdowiczii]MCX0247854.1 HEAT repeat domain-containing protein [Streptomyces drozdowiczii]UZK52788.1 HEAT repeat domain-containing protein [Streptomyces drozdowiczii]